MLLDRAWPRHYLVLGETGLLLLRGPRKSPRRVTPKAKCHQAGLVLTTIPSRSETSHCGPVVITRIQIAPRVRTPARDSVALQVKCGNVDLQFKDNRKGTT
ncbi:hypothetical protein MTP99_008892 [Tenebrio molitor]|jgi:hypothetical protein|nr:hypothetical protein MTP99_008892 [Tenebrio molitor]